MPGALLLLNGPPGIGKSTVARLLVSTRPLALCLDIDLLRRSLGQWTTRPDESGLLARDLAVVAAEQHLRSGHGVVVPQFLGRLDLVERLERLSGQLGADFVHLVLMDGRRAAARRFLARTDAAGATDQHREAAAMAGGEAGLGRMYDALLSVLALRPGAVLVPSTEGDVVGTLARVQDAVAGRW